MTGNKEHYILFVNYLYSNKVQGYSITIIDMFLQQNTFYWKYCVCCVQIAYC